MVRRRDVCFLSALETVCGFPVRQDADYMGVGEGFGGDGVD